MQTVLRSCFVAAVVTVGAIAGCNGPAGMPVDTGTNQPDAATDMGVDALWIDVTLPDVPPDDATRADVTPIDAVPVDSGGCNPEGGITCAGDWGAQCMPGCSASQCCSPQHGAFRCVARDTAGNCPLADLFIDSARVASSVSVQTTHFDPASCEVVEHCIDVPGNRRLLRFDTRTPNTGGADMYIGAPSLDNPNFEFSTCHNHWHFNSYAAYQLRNPDGTVAARGHKQAFCLEDFDPYSPGAGPAVYQCGNQGIQRGWSDIYSGTLPCQWVDVTDVRPGQYTLHIDLNIRHVLAESDYSNNSIDVPVTIP